MRVRAAVSLLLLAGAVAGCATTSSTAKLADGETPRRMAPRERDMTAEALQ